MVTAIFSRIFLKELLYKHHLLGLALLIIGLIVVGVSALVTGEDDAESSSNIYIGILVLILAFFTFSI